MPKRTPKPSVSLTVNDLSAFTNAPPQNLEAEKGVIGSILIDPEIADDVIPLLKAEDFYFDAHQRLYRQLYEMRRENSTIDILLLINRLQNSGELDAAGGQEYIGEIMSAVPFASNAVHYANIVREKSVLRQLIHTGSDILQDAYSPAAVTKDVLNQASMKVLELAEMQTINQITDMHSLMMDVTALLDKKARGEVDGVKTGFIDLDNLIDGLHPNELVVLAARPGMGKTALALNIAEHVACTERNTVLVVSLEMGKLELALRFICSRGQIDSWKVRKNRLSKEENGRFMDKAGELAEVPMFIDDTPSRTVAEIAAVARKLKRSNDLQLLIIDYIGLISPENPNDPRQEQVAKIARRLKQLARELHIPILCLAQLNRQVDAGGREGNRPKLSHLRESGAIEQDADVVMFIHREEVYLDKEKAAEKDVVGKAEVIVAKQRNGATDDVKLRWIGEHTRFIDESVHSDNEYSTDFDQYSRTHDDPF